MIEILTRDQFRDHFNQLHPGLGDADSSLWEPEIWETGGRPSVWFVHIQTQAQWDKNEFWTWCRQHCGGHVLCYSQDPDRWGWWGFERREDIIWWVMRWAV